MCRRAAGRPSFAQSIAAQRKCTSLSFFVYVASLARKISTTHIDTMASWAACAETSQRRQAERIDAVGTGGWMLRAYVFGAQMPRRRARVGGRAGKRAGRGGAGRGRVRYLGACCLKALDFLQQVFVQRVALPHFDEH